MRPDLAYAAYVLARNGRPVMGDLRYLADTKIDAFRVAPRHVGRSRRRSRCSAIVRERRRLSWRPSICSRSAQDTGSYRADYGSRLRDGAGLLALASRSTTCRRSCSRSAE